MGPGLQARASARSHSISYQLSPSRGDLNQEHQQLRTSVNVESMEIPSPGRVLNLRLLIWKGSVGLRFSSGMPTGMRLRRSSRVLTRQTLMSGLEATQLFRLLANWSFCPPASWTVATRANSSEVHDLNLMVALLCGTASLGTAAASTFWFSRILCGRRCARKKI